MLLKLAGAQLSGLKTGVKVMISKVEFHCAQEAETLLNLGVREGERQKKSFKFLSKVQAPLFNSVLLESMHLFHIKEKLRVKNRVRQLSYLQMSDGRPGLQQLLSEEF